MRSIFLIFCTVIIVGCSNTNHSSNEINHQHTPIPALTGTIADTTAARMMVDSAKAMIDSSTYDEARTFNNNALDIYDQILPKDDTLRIGQLLNQSSIDRREGNFDLAEASARQALAIAKKSWPANHLTLGDIYHSLGQAYQHHGQFDQSQMYYQKGLEVRAQVLGANHYLVAKSHLGLGIIYWFMGQFEKALTHYQKVLSISDDLEESKVRGMVSSTYMGMGTVFDNQGDYNKAIAYYEKAITLKLTYLKPTNSDFVNIYNNLGIAHDLKGDKQRGIFYYQKSININEQTFGERHFRIGMTCNNLGSAYKELGDYNMALRYHQKSLSILNENLDPNHFRIGEALHNLGIVNKLIGHYTLAEDALKKAYQICLETKGFYHMSTANSLAHLGMLQEHKQQDDEALAYHQKALEVRERVQGRNHARTANSYQRIGKIYGRKGEFQKAIWYLEEAEQILQNLYQSNNLNLALVYADMSTVYLEQGNLSKASQLIRQALSAAQYDLDNPFEFKRVSIPVAAKPVFLALGKYYRACHLQNGDRSYVDSLNLYYQTLMALEDYIRANYLESTTRQYYAEQALPTYEEAINHFYQADPLNTKHDIFQIMEKTKNRQLLEQVKTHLATSDYRLTDSVKTKERNFNLDIAFFEKQLYEAQSEVKTPNDSLINALQDRLFDLKNERYTFLQSLQDDFPDYYQMRYRNAPISLSQTQEWLSKGTHDALIEYFVGDTTLFVTLVMQNQSVVQKIELDFPLKEWITTMRCGIFANQASGDFLCSNAPPDKGVDHYEYYAHQLYQKLFKPIEPLLGEATDLLIIPDGVLGYLPFEALLRALPTPGTDYSQYDYLLKPYHISYAYSATLQQGMEAKTHGRMPTKSLLAFAPSFGDRNQMEDSLMLASRFLDAEPFRSRLSPLEYNDEEARQITALMKGDALLGGAATKAAFLERAPNYRILHLATHGNANDKYGDYSYLAFQPWENDSLDAELLYNSELYNLQLNADMVVLSACETGIGELQRGEGMLSMARGFSYAGAKSMITTLWRIPDRTSSKIMTSFYQYLKDGLPKHEALRLAKLDLIGDLSVPNRSPLFWAGFIGIGDMGTLVSNNHWWNNSLFYALILLIVVGGMGVFYFRQNRARIPM